MQIIVSIRFITVIKIGQLMIVLDTFSLDEHLLPIGKCIPIMKVHHFVAILLIMVQFEAENHSTNLVRLNYCHRIFTMRFLG